MTKKKMPKGRPFQPGQSGNPSGKPKVPDELKVFKPLTSDEMKHLFAKYARMTDAEIQESLADANTPKMERVIAAGLNIAEEEGDYTKLNFILDRTIGKVTEKTAVELPEPVIIRRLSGDEVHLIAEKKE